MIYSFHCLQFIDCLLDWYVIMFTVKSNTIELRIFQTQFARLSLSVDNSTRGQQCLANRPPGHSERSHHALMAGAIGGYVVWGRYSGVNYQIVLYLTSRVLVGLGKHLLQTSYLPEGPLDQSYPLFVAVIWGLAMILFEEHPDVVHPSLKKSMDEFYRYSIRENSRASEYSSVAAEADPPRPQNANVKSAPAYPKGLGR